MVEHFRPADLSGVEVESDALKGAVFYFFNCGLPGKSRAASKAELEGMVKRLGGTARPEDPDRRFCDVQIAIPCLAAKPRLRGWVKRMGVP